MLLIFYQISIISILTSLILLVNRNDKGKTNQKIIGVCFLVCLMNPIINISPVSLPSITYDRKQVINQPASNKWVQDNQKYQIVNNNENLNKSIKNSSYFSLNDYLFLIWLIGFNIQVILAFRELKVFLNIIKNGKQVDIKGCNLEIIASPTTIAPFLFSFIKNYIILPQDLFTWEKSHLENVVSHEMCHYERKDHWYLWLSFVTSLLFWFHPLIKYLTKKQKVLIENGCDIHLLKQGINPIKYAETIIKTAQYYSKSNYLFASMSSNKSQMQNRIKLILAGDQLKPIMKKPIVFSSISSLLFLSSCINFQQLNWVNSTGLIEFVSYDLPVFRKGMISKGDVHISALYDGKSNLKTNIQLEIKNETKQAAWLNLGPLDKFNKHIHTWHFKLKKDAYITGRYSINGVIPDGVVDGVALGLITTNKNGEISILKSKKSLNHGMQPNFVCAWPLGINENEFIRVLPQLTSNNPDTVERILCGAQLVSNGEHFLN